MVARRAKQGIRRCGFSCGARCRFALLLQAGQAGAQPLDKVTFGTNWVAQAEHGGYYQALADGTYKKYGLDVDDPARRAECE